MLKIFIWLLIISIPIAKIFAQETQSANNQAGLEYKSHLKEKTKIHVLKIDPNYFKLELVKAHSQLFGREHVEAIAARKNAVAAINAGFFEIGGSVDGLPSRSLIINGEIFSLVRGMQSLLIIDEQHVSIKRADMQLAADIGGSLFIPDQVNNFSANKENVILYTTPWGPTSLTSYQGYKELLIDKAGRVNKISDHGDNPIHSKGFVLSFPKNKVINAAKRDKAELKLKLFNEDKTSIVFKNRNISMVTGIPMIVQNGKVADNALMLSSDSDFVRKPHARTAVGLDAKGNIMLVAVESDYIKPLSKITLEEVQYILKKKKDIETKTLTLPQLQKIVEEHFSSKNTGRGLSLKELAKFMIEIGCVEAINLDGGGSTAMFFKGKMMNVSIGDEDEAFGEIIRRPVSDAIIVVPRKE